MGRNEYVDGVVRDWEQIAPNADMQTLALVQRLIWSGRLADSILERAAVDSGLRRRGDYEVLSLLRRAEPTLLTPAALANKLLASPSGMTTRIDRLEATGLVARHPDPIDRRSIRVGLTESGRERINEAFDRTFAVYHAFVSTLDESQRSQLDSLLTTILDRLDTLS